MALRAVRRGWVDITGNGWLGPLLKQFITPQMYREVITDLRKGDLHPVCSWVTSTLFCPGVTRFASLGIREVSINTFLACLTRKVGLWSKSLVTLNSEVRDSTREGLILHMLAKRANALYNEFLRSREQLKEFETWLIGQTSVSVEYVLKNVFEQQRETALKRWSDDYRQFVKTLQVLSRMPGLNVFLYEHTLNMYIDEILRIFVEAEQQLPKIPEFSKGDVSVLTTATAHSEESLEKFLKVAKLLGTVEKVAYSTPGNKGSSSRPFGNEGIFTTKTKTQS
jgi:hypothetical protein